jgi:tetratricopeptide (TPR) repeat protein
MGSELPTAFEDLFARFEAAWSGSGPQEIIPFLPPPDSPHRRAVLLELIRIDRDRLRARGQAPRVADYLSTFPELASDPAAVATLQRFQVAPPVAEGDTPSGASGPAATDRPPNVRVIATVVGTSAAPADDLAEYEIERELGRGGMGVVYQARDLRDGRTVAVKMIRADGNLGTAELIRFLAEAEAQRAVDHPHVVRVFKLGESSGRPYMVLEYLPGGSLSGRLKAAGRFAPREAAALVEKLARGVHAAHTHGIFHRDLKPANVLFDATGEPKVADFGLAKRDLSDLTRTGVRLGTPAYMAPEQAEGRNERVAAPTDVWALGVILYECLTGTRPFSASPDLPADQQVLVLLNRVAAAEVPAPWSVTPDIPQALGRVCLKCLEREPADRYPTAEELAEDLRRFLTGVPIAARPVPAAERAVKWARRNPVVAALSAAVLAVSVGLVAALAVMYRDAAERADTERRLKEEAQGLATRNEELANEEAARRKEADAEAARANQVSDFLAGLFRSSDPFDILASDFIAPDYGKLRGRTARDFLADAVKQFRTGLKDQPQVRARLLLTVGNSYRNLGEFAAARPLLEEALAIRQARFAVDSPEVAQVEIALGQLELDLGDYVGSEQRFRRVIEVGSHADLDTRTSSMTRVFLAFALAGQGRPEGIVEFRKEIENRKRLFGPDDRQTRLIQVLLIAYLFDEGLLAEATKLLPEVLRALDGEKRKDDQLQSILEVFADALRGVALIYGAGEAPAALRNSLLLQAEAAWVSALKKAEVSLPREHLYVAMLRYGLGWVYELLGEKHLAKCEAEFRESFRIARATCGLAHPKVMMLMARYAPFLARVGKLAEARTAFDEVLAANLAVFGPDNTRRVAILVQQAMFEASHGNAPAQGLAIAREVLALAEKHKSPVNHTMTVHLLELSGGIDLTSDPRLADALLKLTRPMVATTFGEASAEMSFLLLLHGRARYNRGDWAAGAALLREAEFGTGRLGPAKDAMLATYQGIVARDQGRFADAERHLRRAADLARRYLRHGHHIQFHALQTLAAVLAERREYAEAYAVAAEAFRGTPPSQVNHHNLAQLAMFRTAAGEPSEAAELFKALSARLHTSDDPHIPMDVARAWAFAPPDLTGFDPADVVRRLQAAWGHRPNDNWPWRAAARAHLRSGNPAAAIAAIRGFGGPHLPADNLILGLAAASKSDAFEATARLHAADRMSASAAPTPADPLAYARVYWFDRFEAALMRDELLRAIDPHLAPPPHPKR